MTMVSPIAVLTGDLIQSRNAPAAADAAFELLQTAARDFGTIWDTNLRFTRYRGDGWQVVLDRPSLTLDALLFIRARLRAGETGIDTRIAGGIGAADTLGTADLSDANGAAFVTSGHHLDQMSPKRQLALAGQGVTPAQIAIIDLTEFITASWTATQAEAVACALEDHPRKHSDIANALGITRQAVQSRLAGAGYGYFDAALYAIRNHDFSE